MTGVPAVPQIPPAITRLRELIQALPEADRAIADRTLRVTRATGSLVAPPAMHEWIRRFFGSVEAVESQVVVRTTNLYSLESALFNGLRASRPLPPRSQEELAATIKQAEGDPFCKPEEGTPEDVFGRVRGSRSITASNVAKYDAFHGLVIFDEHNPLVVSEERVADYLRTGREWAERVIHADPEARYFFFMWNALWRSGASITHGHAQVACARDMHYARVEQLRRAALAYRADTGADYFADLVRLHTALGLGLEWQGVRVLASLTPVREREVLLIAPELQGALPSAIYRVLDCFLAQLGVTSFNLAIYMPPLLPSPEDWSGFPVMARLVDRGDPLSRTNDVGAMELFASPVISTDPFRLIEALRDRFAAG